MKAGFRVHGTFTLSSRSMFVVHGEITSGQVRSGMRVQHPAGLDVPVEGIDSVLLSASEGQEESALTFRYGDEAQLERWRGLRLEGQELQLVGPDAG